ncbi:unnamed protein product, partial [Notodromas monacha]
VRGLSNRKLAQEAYDSIKQALLDYCFNVYPNVQNKFGKLLNLLPELNMLSTRGEEFLYYEHINGNAPTQTLLMEMLHAKRK